MHWRFLALAIGLLALAAVAACEHPVLGQSRASGSFIPVASRTKLLAESLDLSTFRNSLGPRRQPGQRVFGDLGLVPTKRTDKMVEFESDDWLIRLTVLEQADKNGDGLEDLVVEFHDQAKAGTYRTTETLLVTRFGPTAPLIAIAFTP